MQAPYENSHHNGGLIDFHESALRADLGSALYAHQSMSQSMPQNAYHPGIGLGQPVPAGFGMQSGFPPAGLAQPGFAQTGFAQPAYAMAQAPSQCIAGPPAFVHLHGQVYRPVEEALGTPSAPEPVAPRDCKEAAKPKSAKSIERMVEQRVEQRVEEFLAKTSKGRPASRNQAKRNQDDSLHRESLKSLNQQMRQRL